MAQNGTRRLSKDERWELRVRRAQRARRLARLERLNLTERERDVVVPLRIRVRHVDMTAVAA